MYNVPWIKRYKITEDVSSVFKGKVYPITIEGFKRYEEDIINHIISKYSDKYIEEDIQSDNNMQLQQFKDKLSFTERRLESILEYKEKVWNM